ncbi:MAG: efflux RND transporter periplasmic adaptor subunit [Alphaproteobacteria bacterium]|nr:efflux RND transporter periplasmic adaptor subunit [Alphaproteobacteria bacterium]
MRVITQLAVIAVLAGGGYYGWQYWQGRQAQIGAPAAGQGAGRPGQQVPPVVVAPARQGRVTDRVESVGTARSNEAVTITAKQTGVVAKIAFGEGQRVRPGTMLVELESKERVADLEQARADLEQAKAARDDARQQLDRAKQLRVAGTVTESRLEQLDAAHRVAEARLRAAEFRIAAAQARLDDTRITAPFDGKVGLRQVSIGALVQPGTVITTLDDVSRIKLEFSVPENVLGQLRIGLPVIGRAQAYGSREFKGQIAVIDSRIDVVTRSIKVNALFDNADEALKPGLFLTVVLALTDRENAILIPEEAVVPEGFKAYVFVVANNRVQRRAVALGLRLPGEVEVTDGLKPGETVIVEGVQKVRDGQTVMPRPAKPAQS